MEKLDLFLEGRTKRLYRTDNENFLILEFKDNATAFDGQKKGKIEGKGAINNQISSHLFKYLESHHVATHFDRSVSPTEMLVKKVEIIPIEVVVRNVVSGRMVTLYGWKEGEELKCPVVEYYLKDNSLSDPMINESHVMAFELAEAEEVKALNRIARKVNVILRPFFDRRELLLVDFKLEFGRHKNYLLVTDEISPDTCRIWDKKSKKKLDRDRFRKDMGGVKDAYQEVLTRIVGAESFQSVIT